MGRSSTLWGGREELRLRCGELPTQAIKLNMAGMTIYFDADFSGGLAFAYFFLEKKEFLDET